MAETKDFANNLLAAIVPLGDAATDKTGPQGPAMRKRSEALASVLVDVFGWTDAQLILRFAMGVIAERLQALTSGDCKCENGGDGKCNCQPIEDAYKGGGE